MGETEKFAIHLVTWLLMLALLALFLSRSSQVSQAAAWIGGVFDAAVAALIGG